MTRVYASPSIVQRLVALLYGEVVDLEEGEEEIFWKAALDLGLQHLVNAIEDRPNEDDDDDDDSRKNILTSNDNKDGQPIVNQTNRENNSSHPQTTDEGNFVESQNASSRHRPSEDVVVVKTEFDFSDSSTNLSKSASKFKVGGEVEGSSQKQEEEADVVTYGDVLGLEDFASRSGRESDWDEGLDILGIKLPSELVLQSLVKFKEEFNRLCEGKSKSEEETADFYNRLSNLPFPR